MLLRYAACCVLIVGACSKKQDSAGGAKEERPAPIEVKVNKVEQLASVAANKTYEEQGLGKKAPDGKVFACVQYTLTSKSDKPETIPAPVLTDAKGAEVPLSMTAAGNYMPEDWKADLLGGKLEPGASAKKADCFEVSKDAATGMSLAFVDTGWGPKFKPWHTKVALP